MVTTEYLSSVEKHLNEKVKKINFKSLKNKDLYVYQDYLIFNLYTEIPPRRLADYNMKVITSNTYNNFPLADKKKSNYVIVHSSKDVLQFSFGDYKTAKAYGVKLFNIDGKLENIVLTWLKMNPTKNFLINKQKQPMSNNFLGKVITRIFSSQKHPNVSVNQLRHSYISNKYKPVDKDMNRIDDANKMGHSTSQLNDYIKVK